MKSRSGKAGQVASAVAAALTAAATGVTYADVPAADAADTEAASETVNEVVVTGTRRSGLQAIDSPAPIEVLDSAVLKRTGQPDLIQALAQNLPSFTAQAFGGDTANLTLSAKLRGLSPNHALVLVNGKRRHTTANLAVLGGPFQGSAAADLNFIPVDAIDHIEVLQDGAAAQYGTDAIAGVVNIILKKNATGGVLNASGGGFMDGGGATEDVSGNLGYEPAEGSYINLTAESRYHAKTDRGGIDPRVVAASNLKSFPNTDMPYISGYPHLNHVSGDASYHLDIASLNAGIQLGGVEVYGFATYGHKHGQAFENYRLPNRIENSAGVPMYPAGFNPQEELVESDYAATGGIRGQLADWKWDLSGTYGRDFEEINTISSGNASLFLDTGYSPTTFQDGHFIGSQFTNNLDITRDFDIGLATPLNFALGGEWRRETFAIEAGDAASRYKEGGQSYPGFALSDAASHDRKNTAGYVDFAVSPIPQMQLDLAGRYEHYTDFGNKTVGKFSARYDFTPAFALRGTASTGFRAPTLAEEFYSATNVSPTSATVQLPPNSPAAKLIGINGLKPENSTNYSLGVVTHPVDRLSATLDAYQITITDRIFGSGTLYGSGGAINSPAVLAAILAHGNVLDPTVTMTGVSIFSNGLDTRTRGAELVLNLPSDYLVGHVDWSLSGNYNQTKVTKIAATPSQLATGVSFYDKTAIGYLETASPKYRILMGGVWTLDKYSVSLRETLYGESSLWESRNGGTYYLTRIGVTPITDIELGYKPGRLKVAVGAYNAFNRYPSTRNGDLLNDLRSHLNQGATDIYPTFSPFGFNGGYYYGKLSYEF